MEKKNEVSISHATGLIILDINGILCWKYPLDRSFPDLESFKLSHYNVVLRPKIREFLDFCYSYADVGFFSSTTPSNANAILNHILTPSQRKKTIFFWYRDRTKLDPSYGSDPSIKIGDTIK